MMALRPQRLALRANALSRSANPLSRSTERDRAAPWGWAFAGLVFGAVLMGVVSAPAAWVASSVNALGRGSVLMTHAHGTVWSGSAQLALSGGAGSRDTARLPGRVHWTVTLGWGRVNAALSASCCTVAPLQLTLSPLNLLTFWNGWRVQVQAHQSSWPAALLAGLGTPWNTVQAEGTLAVRTPGFTVSAALDRMTLTGEIALEAQDMQSRLSTLKPLGSYRMNVTGGEQPALVLTTLKGDLQLSGQGRWNAGKLRFQGEASAEPAHAQELSNLLNILGRRDGVRSIITLG